MKKEVGNKDFAIWLLGDSNPAKWEKVLETPLDPRHPTRHNIWTPVLDVIQDKVFRTSKSRIDASSIYIRNAVESPNDKPLKNDSKWHTKPKLSEHIEELEGLLYQHKPIQNVREGLLHTRASPIAVQSTNK